MLNIKTLEELKVKVETHKQPEWAPKDSRKYKAQYDNDKEQIIQRIDLITKYQEKIDSWQDDIAEALARLKKQGVIFLEEQKEPEPPAQPPKEQEQKRESGVL
jgi:hypothetical protein